MKGHNLMQAIARVNRVFKDKQGGLVVDYIGIANELKQALKEYTASKGRGRPTVDAHEAYRVLAEKLDVLRAMLHGFDYSGFLTGGHKHAGRRRQPCARASRTARSALPTPALAMSKAFTLCCTLDEAKAVREEVAFFQAVKVILTKSDISSKKKTDEERELAIRQIISSAVVSEEVVDIFDAVGLDKPNIGILDDEFLAEVRNLPERNLAVELLERLLEGEIKTRFAEQRGAEQEVLRTAGRRHQALPEPLHRNRAGDGRAGRDGEEVPARRPARGERAGPDRRRGALLRRAGQQRIGGARTERRNAEENRP